MPEADDPSQQPDPPRDRGGRRPPQYTRYRARPRLFGRGERALPSLEELRAGAPAAAPAGEDAPYRTYGARRRGLRGPRLPRTGGPVNGWRIVKWVVLAALGWLLVSVAAFVISATLHQDSFAGTRLDDGGFPPFGTTTILVLGSDARPKGSKEPGAQSQVSRADTIMLLRIGGGHNAKLSIPRDTVAAIPGHGTNKINAAYAFGGPALMVETVRQFLGLQINHVIEIDFANFPKLIDAMGGIDYTGGCVVARINGGARNGGVTLRLRKGTSHLDGKHALALARVRKNLCNPRENDLTRARRQQKILTAMKSRALSIAGFLRGPFIGWSAPQAIKTDMAGPTLLGVAAALATSGTAEPHVLRPTGATVLPDGGQALTVTGARKAAAVRAFIRD